MLCLVYTFKRGSYINALLTLEELCVSQNLFKHHNTDNLCTAFILLPNHMIQEDRNEENIHTLIQRGGA